MSIFPRMNQRQKIILPIRSNLSNIPEHTEILTNTQISSIEDGPTVVARYRNLTIGAGATLTTSNRCCGLVLVVDGDLIVESTASISMAARGAFFAPTVNHKIKNNLFATKDIIYKIDIPATANEIADFLKKEKRRYTSFDELPAIYRPTFQTLPDMPAILGEVNLVGGAGAAKVTSSTSTAGIAGSNGTDRSCGGGGSGSARFTSSGAGAAGTCYSGGAGGGGGAQIAGATAGALYGGAGGNAVADTYGAGGGAGNPGGTGAGADGTKGSDGTGGLLIIFCTGQITVKINGSINCNGSRGGGGNNVGGGGSGGGSLNIFYNLLENKGTISANGGAGGAGGARIGGNGGNGCVTLDQFNF